jgi:hypothetical protein
MGNNAFGIHILVDDRFCQPLAPIDFSASTERGCIAVATALRNEWELFSMTAIGLNVVSFGVVRNCSISP